MYRIAVVYVMLITGFSASAQTVTIRGTVTNQSGRGLSGAVVELLSQDLRDTTDSRGTYILSRNVAVNPITFLPRTDHICLDNGIVSLGLMKAAPVRIEFFDMRGNLLKRVLDNSIAVGDYKFKVISHPLAANMTVIQVSVGQCSFYFRYLPLYNGRRLVASQLVGLSTKKELIRAQSSVDSLKVTASGYLGKKVPITSYEDSVDITLDTIALPLFSFFVTSMKALQKLSGSELGFGGDFRFGKTGAGAGLLGADSICECIAERSMPGSKVKQWRAFLSVAEGPDGRQVNAIDRIGQGPWYDRVGRLLSNNISELKNTRPAGADVTIKLDLPNEDGIPNQRPDSNLPVLDNHHTMTGSDTNGTLYSATATCADWTSTTYSEGPPWHGFSWTRRGPPLGETGTHWMSGWYAPGCAAGTHVYNNQPHTGEGMIIGGGGGYGGFYCFALNP